MILDHLARIVDLLLVLGPFFIWLWRWTRTFDTTVKMTKQVTDTHLPFIYHSQHVHDIALKIEPVEHPNIGLTNGGGAAPLVAQKP